MKAIYDIGRLVVFSTFMLWLTACTNLIFVPMERLVRTPDQVGVEYKDIMIESQDGVMLHGWYLPATVELKGSIVFFHGNGENISTHLETVYWLPDQGYEVFMVDYRGYGRSSGEVQLKGSIADVQASIDYAIKNKNSEQGVVVLGHSFGGSLGIYSVAHYADKNQINGLISIGAFSDYRLIVRDVLARSWLTWLFQWPLSFTINNDFAAVDYVKDVAPVPLLVMHSASDRIVPYYHSGLLYEAAVQPKYFVELEGDHNHTFQYENNRAILLNYLEQLMQ